MTRRARALPSMVLAAWLTLVAGCTGTQETTTPVALVVAGADADSGEAAVGLLASGLPPDPTADDPPLTWLPGFRRTVAGTIVDVAVARDDPVRLYVLHRDDRDVLTVFDASALDLDDPTSFQATDTIELGQLVANAGVADLPDPDSLCSRGLVVSSDGRWAGVVHEAAACGGVDDAPAVLLIELEPDAGSEPRVIPEVPSTDDAPGTPVIAPRGGEPILAWPTRGGEVLALTLSDPGRTPEPIATTDGLSNVLSAGRGGQGLIVLDEDALIGVPVVGDTPARLWEAPAGATLVRVVDAHLLPGTPALALASNGLVVVADVDAEAGGVPPVIASVPSSSDAVVGPYGYAFVTAQASVTVFDVLTFLADPGTSIGREAVASLEALSDPVAVDWLFVSPAP